jgi:hypothetical protein
MGEEYVERRPGRMSDAQVARGENELAAVHERHGWSEGPEVDDEGRDRSEGGEYEDWSTG